MKKSAALAGLVLLNYIVASSAAQASTVYTVLAIPTIAGSIAMIPTAINDHKDVAGYTYMSNGDSLAYSYINGNAALVPTLGGTRSSATGINNAGAIVGWSMTSVPGEYRPFLAAPGQAPSDLETLEGRMSIATGINNSGVISGYSSLGIPYDTGYAAFTTSPSAGLSKIDFERLEVSDAFANGINDFGSVAGTVFSTAAGGWQAFVDDANGVRLLPTLGGNNAQAMAINNHGAVIGFSNLATGEGRAFVYDGTNMVDLGALSGSDIFGYGLGTLTYSSAVGINDAGTIVGSSG
jgi:probable HAF family extracellular repeat protein